MFDEQKIAKIKEQYDKLNDKYSNELNKIENYLYCLLKKENNFLFIKSRVKTLDSLTKKLEKGIGEYNAIHKIDDVIGVRIGVFSKADIEKIINIIMNTNQFVFVKYNQIPERFDDKGNLQYYAKHFVFHLKEGDKIKNRYIRCELQITTALENIINELQHDVLYKNILHIKDNAQISYEQIESKISDLRGKIYLIDDEIVNIRGEINALSKGIEEYYSTIGKYSNDKMKLMKNSEIDSLINKINCFVRLIYENEDIKNKFLESRLMNNLCYKVSNNLEDNESFLYSKKMIFSNLLKLLSRLMYVNDTFIIDNIKILIDSNLDYNEINQVKDFISLIVNQDRIYMFKEKRITFFYSGIINYLKKHELKYYLFTQQIIKNITDTIIEYSDNEKPEIKTLTLKYKKEEVKKQFWLIDILIDIWIYKEYDRKELDPLKDLICNFINANSKIGKDIKKYINKVVNNKLLSQELILIFYSGLKGFIDYKKVNNKYQFYKSIMLMELEEHEEYIDEYIKNNKFRKVDIETIVFLYRKNYITTNTYILLLSKIKEFRNNLLKGYLKISSLETNNIDALIHIGYDLLNLKERERLLLYFIENHIEQEVIQNSPPGFISLNLELIKKFNSNEIIKNKKAIINYSLNNSLIEENKEIIDLIIDDDILNQEFSIDLSSLNSYSKKNDEHSDKLDYKRIIESMLYADKISNCHYLINNLLIKYTDELLDLYDKRFFLLRKRIDVNYLFQDGIIKDEQIAKKIIAWCINIYQKDIYKKTYYLKGFIEAINWDVLLKIINEYNIKKREEKDIFYKMLFSSCTNLYNENNKWKIIEYGFKNAIDSLELKDIINIIGGVTFCGDYGIVDAYKNISQKILPLKIVVDKAENKDKVEEFAKYYSDRAEEEKNKIDNDKKVTKYLEKIKV